MADNRTDLYDSVHNRTSERPRDVHKPINERIQGTDQTQAKYAS